MELTIGASFALVSCLYLSVVTSPASAKCHGRWAIHACYGGNGKRSDPSLSHSSKMPPSLLHRVLLSDAQRLNQMLQEETSPPTEEDLFMSPQQYGDEDFKDSLRPTYRQQLSRTAPELTDLRRYIKALEIQHALRQREQEDLM